MAEPLQFATRTQKGVRAFDADPVYAPLAGFEGPTGTPRCCVYSPCGRYFAWASNEAMKVTDAATGAAVASLAMPGVYEIEFSPYGTYFSTWERPSKDEAGDATKNLKVWRTVEDVADGTEKEPIGRFVQKSMSGWSPQYTADEKYCARLVTNEVQFYESGDLKTVWNHLRVEGVSGFALSPGAAHAVAVFVPERNGQPSAIKVFNVPQFANPVSQKTFFKGDKVQLKWNEAGSSLLALAQTEVDKSNKSYYGETTLYILSVTGQFDARVALDKEGPIHDVSWSPNSKEFGVVYGFMPAKTTIFNQRAVATHSFQIGPRNTIIFSPTGRFALVAGFGNLAGQIDVYDLERNYLKICTIDGGSPSVCQWSPDSRFIMTATTSPRLRVDNGVKLWHVGGTLMYNEDFVELYNVIWRPVPPEKRPAGDALQPVPAPHASAASFLSTVKTPSKPAGAYRPPGARGTSTPLHFKREDEGGAAHVMSNGVSALALNGFGRPRGGVPGAELAGSVPGAEAADGEDGASKAASKNKKKRANKKAKEAAAAAEAAGGSSLSPPAGDGFMNGERSPERNPRAAAFGRHSSRSQSRSNQGRNRSNTHRSGLGGPESRPRSVSRHVNQRNPNPNPFAAGGNNNGSNLGNLGSPPPDAVSGRRNIASPPPEALNLASPTPGTTLNLSTAVSPALPAEASITSPLAKKRRGLEKKIRAIEDLEVRLANGEKLEDTQMKKIGTKTQVLKELEVVERDLGGN